MTSATVVIPTLNAADWLGRCLDTMLAMSSPEFDLIVFDDGSTEAIAPVVHQRFPEAFVIRSDSNVGLARAFNIALERCHTPYVIFLNNDTEVSPTWLHELIACADRHPTAGSVASKIRLLADRRILHSAGDTWSVRGMPGNRGVWLDDFGQYDVEEEIFAACGGAVLYRREALDDVKVRDGFVFDESLFMYCEDVDLGWRLQTAGWPCVFAPQATVYHALSATGGGRLASYYVARNVWCVMSRSVPNEFLNPHRSRIAAFHLGRVMRTMRHLREPAARASLRGSIVGLWRAARLNKHPRALSDDERQRIDNLLTGHSIHRQEAVH